MLVIVFCACDMSQCCSQRRFSNAPYNKSAQSNLGTGWHKGLRIRNVCIVFVKDRCANVRYFSVHKQE